MIVLFDKPNQLCNRIWSQAPVIAKAIGSKQKVKIPFFGEYFHLFQNLGTCENVFFSKRKNKYYIISLRIAIKLLKLMPELIKRVFDVRFTTNLSQINWQNNQGVTYTSGWKDSASLMKHHQDLIRIFAPKNNYKKRVDNFFRDIQSEVKIGVHIRRGDYIDFKKGIYFFDNEKYKTFMIQVAAFKELENKEIIFILCSNEAQELDSFKPLNATKMPGANGIEDLYLLSLCDYILGPPSSFSQWASFFGQKPLHFVENNTVLQLAKFKKVVAKDQFSK